VHVFANRVYDGDVQRSLEVEEELGLGLVVTPPAAPCHGKTGGLRPVRTACCRKATR